MNLLVYILQKVQLVTDWTDLLTYLLSYLLKVR